MRARRLRMAYRLRTSMQARCSGHSSRLMDAGRAASGRSLISRRCLRADLFSRDGWKELSYVGTYVGRERIRQSVKVRYPNPKSPNFLTIHQVVQPVIHVSADARSAKIRGRLFQMGGSAGGEGAWISGIYENS